MNSKSLRLLLPKGGGEPESGILGLPLGCLAHVHKDTAYGRVMHPTRLVPRVQKKTTQSRKAIVNGKQTTKCEEDQGAGGMLLTVGNCLLKESKPNLFTILHASAGETQGTSTPNPVYLPHSRDLWPFIWPKAQLSKLPPVNSRGRYLIYSSHEQCQLLESKLVLNLKAEFIQLWILAYFHTGSSKNKFS